MQYPKTTSTTAVLLILLLAGAVSPDTSARLVQPLYERIAEGPKQQRAKEQMRQERWEALETLARLGDTNSMNRVVSHLLNPVDERLPELPADSSRAWQLLEDAAARGSFWAAYSLWNGGRWSLEQLEDQPGAISFPEVVAGARDRESLTAD
ncbi:MAG: hypothetical protein JJ896_03345 [Rhodothermales bacterium]|nr:hypothetical protein [Rhodothermales bacterium]MBO6778669.1 hypothetical protein [Rhodothermales bacterium]